MTVEELIKKLKNFPGQTRVILDQEFGAGELDDDNIKFEIMNYNEYEPVWPSPDFPVRYGWEYPSSYARKTIKTERVVVIS